jgi:Flp pilus assembly protein TadG
MIASTRSSRLRNQRGFSLPLLAVCLTVMLGMLGLAFDMGRMFITRNELQTFADASALAAVYQLDGTQAGIQGANATATAGPLGTTKPNGYNFDSTPISTVTATYATDFTGTYDSYATASGPATNSYRFINVTASASVPMNFIRVLPGISTAYTFTASAIAGAQATSSASYGGLEPFVPDAHNTADTKNWGFIPGTGYTLKWGSGGGNGNGTTTCAGDQGWSDPNPASQHGFADLGQGNGNSSLRGVIVYGGYPNADSTPSSVYAGLYLSGVPGNRGSSIFSSLSERAAQDTDDTSTTYAAYVAGGTGNGRRVVTVPVGDPSTWTGNGNGSEKVIGFANFFLDPTYSGSSGAICATYIGPANMNGLSTGASDSTKIYYNALFK